MPAKKLLTLADEKSKYARLTTRQWAEAEALWARGEVTLTQLSERYGKDVSAFTKHFRKKGLEKGSKAAEVKEKVEAAIDREMVTEAEITAQRVRETKDEHYKMSKALSQMAFSEVLQAKKAGIQLGAIIANLKAIESAMNTVKKGREERYAVLGLDNGEFIDDEQIPVLNVSDLTEEEIFEIQNGKDGIDDIPAEDLELDAGLDEEEDDDEDGVVEEGDE
jgi:hypothetical protein